jgi:hypothetical protein
MNYDTFASFSSAYPSGHPFALPAAITTTSVTETAFLLANGNQAVISVPTGKEILGSGTPFDPNANSAYGVEGGRAGKWMGETRPYFNSNSFNNRAFRLRAFGYISGGGTTLTSVSASINIYAALTQVTTVTSGTKITNLGITGGLGNVGANWMVELNMLWDSVSQQLNGQRSLYVGNLVTASGAALTAVGSLAQTSLNFGLTWIFATSSTANAIGLTELSLEQV